MPNKNNRQPVQPKVPQFDKIMIQGVIITTKMEPFLLGTYRPRNTKHTIKQVLTPDELEDLLKVLVVTV